MFVSQIFDEASEILGTTDQSKVFRKLTQAVQALMESGHWFHTQAEVDVCTGWDGCTVTLPKGIEVPLAVNIDGSPLYFRGRLFQYHVNKGGVYNSVDWCWDDRGFVATQMDIRQPSQVVAVAESDADVGKTLRLVGTNQWNRDLRGQLPDGTGVDGLIVQIHSLSDFARGSIKPDNNTIVTRSASITPFNEFTSSSDHQFGSGENVVLSSATGTVPTGLTVSTQYYVGVVSPTKIQLYTDPLYAQKGEYPINLTSIAGAGTLELTNQRNASLVTALSLSTTPTISLEVGNEIVFSGSPLPSPLVAGVTYFINQIDSNTLQIYASLSDAQTQTNPIYLSGSIIYFNAQIRKPIAPITNLVFNYPHLFQTKDVVQAYTNGGTLPQPLVSAQNYYVQVVDPLTIILHTSALDAETGNNPVVLTTSGSGQNTITKLIPASASIGKTANITAHGFTNLPTATGSGATVTATVSGPVTSLTLVHVGSGYTSAPTVTLTGGGGYGATAHAVVGTIPSTSQYQTVIALVLDNPGAGYTSAPTVVFSGGGGTNASGTSSVTNSFVTSYSIVNGGSGYTVPPYLTFPTPGPGQTAPIATSVIADGVVSNILITNPGTGYTTPPSVSFSGGNGYGATATAIISGGNVTSVVITAGGSGYTSPPGVVFTGGGGSNASADASISDGAITSINVVSQGTGYSTAPVVTVTPSTGVFVSFSTTGTLPEPLKEGATYRAEAPSTSAGQFTLFNDDYSPVSIASIGSGQLYLDITRSFSVGFTNTWSGDFSGTPTGTSIYFGTDYLLPVTSPPIDNGSTAFSLIRLTNTTAQVYAATFTGDTTSGTNFISNVSSTAGLSSGNLISGSGVPNGTVITHIDDPSQTITLSNNVTVDQSGGNFYQIVSTSQLGTGQSYFALQYSVTAISYENLVFPSYLEFLQDDTRVRFSSSGTLPTPLDATTDYKISVTGNNVKVKTMSGFDISFSDLGVGQLYLKVIRDVVPVSPNTVTLENAFFDTGTSVIPRPVEGDILDPHLIAGTTYYVRFIDSGTIALYDTQKHANNTTSTTGLITFTTVGNSSTSTFFLDAVGEPTFVKAISHVEKPITEGYISLYAYDYGRSNDMALIGQYHPSEVNPKYRRIRVGKPAAWARIIYRVKHPTITSIYDYIPVEQERAIIAAVHAIDLEDKDFAEQAAKYWQLAFGYLRNQQSSMDGHAMEPIQVNGLTYGDQTDPIIDSGSGYIGYW